MQLKVTVPLLNKRSLVPLSLPDTANIAGVVKEGFTFEGQEVDISQLPNPAMGKWYRDRDGYFYWGGGVIGVEETLAVPTVNLVSAEVGVEGAIPFDPNKMSWGHKFYDIPFIWNDLGTKGKGVTVAVIDTGVDVQHADLIGNIHPLSKSFVGNVNDIQDMDTKSHGTRMAGIIASSGKQKVFGIAPEAQVLIVKATLKKNDASVNLFTDAVRYVTSLPEVDIVSISYTLEDTPGFKGAIRECLSANKIVVAAIGNLRDTDFPEDPDTFPSSYNSGKNNTNGDEVIAIGAFDNQKRLCSFSNSNKHLSFLSPGESILTAGSNNSVINEDGTSISAAFTAGCLALMVSYSKLNNKPVIDCAKALLSTCDDLGPEIGFDPKSGFGFLNFRNAIAKIK